MMSLKGFLVSLSNSIFIAITPELDEEVFFFLELIILDERTNAFCNPISDN